MGTIPNMNLLEQFGEVTYYLTTTPEKTLARIKDADIVITNKVILDSATIAEAKNLKLICVAATGTNNVDKAAAAEFGIPVKNVVDYSSNSVAQGTFSLLLHLMINIPYYDKYVKQGKLFTKRYFYAFWKTFLGTGGQTFRHCRPGQHRKTRGKNRRGVWFGSSLLFSIWTKRPTRIYPAGTRGILKNFGYRFHPCPTERVHVKPDQLRPPSADEKICHSYQRR